MVFMLFFNQEKKNLKQMTTFGKGMNPLILPATG